jgi:hypothetical protein
MIRKQIHFESHYAIPLVKVLNHWDCIAVFKIQCILILPDRPTFDPSIGLSFQKRCWNERLDLQGGQMCTVYFEPVAGHNLTSFLSIDQKAKQE